MPNTQSRSIHTPFGRRTLGNPYASDATYEAAVVLASNKRCWDLLEQSAARREDGTIDEAVVRSLFAPKLSLYGISGLKLSEINWAEVAAEFTIEAPAPQRQADEAGGQVTSPPTEDDPAEEPSGGAALAAAKAIDPDVLEVLRQSELTPQGLRLPAVRLERKLYERVDQVLKSLGGKWDRRIGEHRFSADDLAATDVAIATGRYLDPKEFGFFPTPQDVGRQLIEAADLRPGHLVLEPSAGQGALADLAATVVGAHQVKVAEMLPRNRQVLADKGFEILGEDFLAMEPEPMFDRIIMNPPFGGLADVEHVTHAARFLRDGGSLVAIMSPSFTFRETSKARGFRDLLDSAGEQVAEVPAGAFAESGTDVRTVIVRLDADRLPQHMRVTLPESAAQRQRERG